RVKDKTELIDVTRYVLENFNQPALIETFLPGREFTTAIIGTGKDARVIGTMEILFKDHIKDPFYSYFNKENYQGILDYELVKDKAAEDSCSEVALAAWQALGCRDAGRIDLKMDENNIPNFIEVNPLAGLRPIHSDLIIIAGLKGICYSELIGNIMQQAIKRVGLK
ncbi:MAG: hypothetical protein KA792_08040, partial [Bacteroidales bacterium]|nr:hypothetical protein [Bacteroidales bacterium]